jgi:hypothetical protein
MIGLNVRGLKPARAFLDLLRSGVTVLERNQFGVRSDLVYAPGIETGRGRGGRLARRAGGAYFMRDALAHVQPRIVPALVDALPRGPAAVTHTMEGLAHDVLTRATELLTQRVYGSPIPRSPGGRARWARTGNLRRSLHTVRGARL